MNSSRKVTERMHAGVTQARGFNEAAMNSSRIDDPGSVTASMQLHGFNEAAMNSSRIDAALRHAVERSHAASMRPR